MVTGMGSVSPFGCDVDESWGKLLDGRSCASLVESVNLDGLNVKIGGEVKWKKDGGWFDPAFYMNPRDVNRTSRFVVYGLVAADIAMKDAGLGILDDSMSERCATVIGTGAGGMDAIEDGFDTLATKGPARLTPFFVPSLLCNLAPGQISIKHNAQGPSFAVVSACASGNNAIGEAYRMIKDGRVDYAISGGSESTYATICFAGFAALRALSTRNDAPHLASRPFDKDRDGFVMSEGAGVLILEDYESAKKRGANIYAEILGYGTSSDANHITAPHPDGRGARQSMSLAMQDARLSVDDIDYINAHGTSTMVGDELEVKAIRDLFGSGASQIPLSSTKSSTGHMLGAAAALEAIFCIKALRTGIVPATINLDSPSEICDGMNMVPNKPQEMRLKKVMSNAFGFGGCNATIIVGLPE